MVSFIVSLHVLVQSSGAVILFVCREQRLTLMIHDNLVHEFLFRKLLYSLHHDGLLNDPNTQLELKNF